MICNMTTTDDALIHMNKFMYMGEGGFRDTRLNKCTFLFGLLLKMYLTQWFDILSA